MQEEENTPFLLAVGVRKVVDPHFLKCRVVLPTICYAFVIIMQ